MKASVIIPAYNNLEDLRLLLPSVERQELGHHELEVILRDDGSRDDTCAWVKAHYPRMLLLSGENVGFSKCNNIAVQHATGSVLVFINADTVLDPKFISAGLNRFEQETRLGGINSNMIMPWVMDLQRFIDGERPAAGCGYFLNRYGFADYRDTESSSRDTGFISGGGCFVRREALEGEDPFFEDLWGGTAYCEDLDLSLRILSKGWRLSFEPAAILYHNQRPIRGSGLSQLKKFARVSANRITVYAINLSFLSFMRIVPDLFYGLFRKIDFLPLSEKMKKKATVAVALMLPLFGMLLPYWIYRNLRSGASRKHIQELSFLNRSTHE
ncbi:MAG: glycosyltransferase [Thermodesulfobacteriota bacterium]